MRGNVHTTYEYVFPNEGIHYFTAASFYPRNSKKLYKPFIPNYFEWTVRTLWREICASVCVFLRRLFSCYCYCLLLFVSQPVLILIVIVIHLVCIAISQRACNNNTKKKNESHFKFSTNVSLYLKWAFGAFFHQNLLLET